ncbi:hypothetical protein UA08_00288 [Talaromyces atroroseus]|uniref:DNA/RNA-binding domain-containing protein n=1 Tax=Talaromyces atroroseus TaxID=1441469 RepID=A0A225BAI7_TALAT|nr:hypothetical protein UA08_00288 [Talaromyces atroroseus]OKL63935.1 hypothetical protein UA08_00288 [Talaromyces atroroseus]
MSTREISDRMPSGETLHALRITNAKDFYRSTDHEKHPPGFVASANSPGFKELRLRNRASQEYEISSNAAQRSSRGHEFDSSPPGNDNITAKPSNVQRQSVEYAHSSTMRDVHPPTAQPSGIFLQPETHPITEDQLINEVRAIYAGLVMVEKKCIEIVKQQNEKPEELTDLQWQAIIALHRTLLHEHHDFFLASNHPVASETLKELARTYTMPARMWRYGIHSFLELLRKRLPFSLEHMLTFIYMAYAMITLLLESVPAFEETWIECLGDLARYRMAIEEVDMHDREIYTGVARYWYTKAADLNPDVGRIQHHLAVLARPNQLQQLFYYSKALISVQSFTNARDSILLLFNPLLDPARAANKYSKYYPRVLTLFVEAHAALFTRHDVSTFITPAEQFLDQLDKHAGIIGPLFREQGVYIVAANYAAIFDFGHDDAIIPSMFNGLSQRSEMLDKAYKYWQENTACIQTDIACRTTHDQTISNSRQAASFASHFAFTTLDIILERLGDNNTLPCVHVSLAFLWCAAMVPGSMSYIQADVPWARLATFLNALIRPDTDMSEIVENEEEFPAHEADVSWQLPEDFLMHGLCWSRLYHPPGFFSEIAEDDERSIELPSVAVPRTRRCLWLGARLAKFNRWLDYNAESRTFSATAFANDLAVLSGQHQVLRRGLSGQHDADTSMEGA